MAVLRCAAFEPTRASRLIHFRRTCLSALFLCATSALSASPPAPSPGSHPLVFSIGGRGLETLSFEGKRLLASPRSGDLEPAKSFLRSAFDALFQSGSSPAASPPADNNTVDLHYPWGRVSATYRGTNRVLAIEIRVTNTGPQQIDELPLRLMDLTFPKVPKGRTLDAGMFGFGFAGAPHSLFAYPLQADPIFVAPIIELGFGNSVLNFAFPSLLETSTFPPFIIQRRGLARSFIPELARKIIPIGRRSGHFN